MPVCSGNCSGVLNVLEPAIRSAARRRVRKSRGEQEESSRGIRAAAAMRHFCMRWKNNMGAKRSRGLKLTMAVSTLRGAEAPLFHGSAGIVGGAGVGGGAGDRAGIGGW